VNPLGIHPESFAKGRLVLSAVEGLFSFSGRAWFCLCRGMAACALFASRMSTRGCARYNAAQPHVVIPSEAAFRRRSSPDQGGDLLFPLPRFLFRFFKLSSRAAPSADALRDLLFPLPRFLCRFF
jgi:hypothetical protein